MGMLAGHGSTSIADADFVGDITALSVKEVTRHAKGTMLLIVTPSWETDRLRWHVDNWR
jgi:hypothetical protein